ncbi:L-ectoine synthase, partial [Mesorhizobium sp. M4B.F.Ca.ET.172.01.1.1]
MFTRQLADVEKTDFFVDWGNGTSHRLLTSQDGMGFTVCHTVVR